MTPRAWGLAACLVLLTIGLRQPTWTDRILFIDEPLYYSYGARLTLPGAHVHTHTADMKPPGGPMTYWSAIQVDAPHAIAVVHVFTSIAIAVTAVLLLLTSSLLLRTPWPGFFGGALYVLLGSNATPSGDFGEPFFAFSGLEHFQAPWLALFVLAFALSLERKQIAYAVLAGTALGIAAWYKQNVPVVLLPAAVAAAASVWRGALRPSQAARLFGVCAAVTLGLMGAVPLYFALLGHFAAWRHFTVDVLGIYAGTGGSYLEKTRILASYIPLAPFLGAALVYGAGSAFTDEWPVRGRELRVLLAAVWIVLFLSLGAGLHKAHYLIQALPAQCLLIGLLLVEAWQHVARQSGGRRAAFAAAYVALLVIPLAVSSIHLLGSWRDLVGFINRDEYLAVHRHQGTLEPLLAFVDAHTRPDDLIYVHGEAPEFYPLTQRRPASSDPGGGMLIQLKSSDEADRLLADLQATPPRLIIQFDYHRYGRVGERLQKWPRLAAWLAEHYQERPVADHVQVLERREGDA